MASSPDDIALLMSWVALLLVLFGLPWAEKREKRLKWKRRQENVCQDKFADGQRCLLQQDHLGDHVILTVTLWGSCRVTGAYHKTISLKEWAEIDPRGKDGLIL